MKATTTLISVFSLRTMIPRENHDPAALCPQGPRHGHPDERLVDLPVGVIATGLGQCRSPSIEHFNAAAKSYCHLTSAD